MSRGKDKTLEQYLNALREGQISFNQFARYTARDWDRLSTRVYTVWRRKIPVGVSVEDVRQEMLLHAWRAVEQYDPELGPSLRNYVVFIACSKAARFLHSQRSALRRDGKAESRHPTTFSQLLHREGEDDGAEWLDALMAYEDQPDELVDAARKFETATQRAVGVDLYILIALKQALGNIPKAAEALFDEHVLGVARGWGSPADVAGEIEKTVCALCA